MSSNFGQLVELNREILKAIDFMIEKSLHDVELNSTQEGIVVSVLGNNQYSVRINGIDYTIPGTEMPASNYIVGMTVWVEVPWNDFQRKYIKCQKPY